MNSGDILLDNNPQTPQNPQNTNALIDYYTQQPSQPKLSLYNPNILLSGHKGEIYTGKFSREGFLYATAGHDRSIMLWETFEENCRNITTLQGHSNAILDLQWSVDDSRLFTCSADKTVCIWDVYAAKRIKKLKAHDSFVNALDINRRGPEMVIK